MRKIKRKSSYAFAYGLALCVFIPTALMAQNQTDSLRKDKDSTTDKSLDEVVGYGTQKRGSITGSIATIKGSDISNLVTPSVDKMLQGKVAGLQVSVPSGILGQAARMRIRGTSSITSGSDPLYVIDGVPYISDNQGSATPYNPISDINPNDIVDMQVLKDGAATAIYGSRAANGVILITTKSGHKGSPRINYDSWFAWSSPSKKFHLLNADQFVEIANEKFTNRGLTGPAHFDSAGTNTDWQNVILHTGFQQSHSLSLSGANENTNYYISMGYVDMDGTTVSNSLRKYNFRAKVDQKALDGHLLIGANLGLSYNQNKGLNTGTSALSGNMGGALRLPPNVAEFNADGTYNLSPTGTLGAGPNDQVVDDNYTNIGYVLSHNVFKSNALNLTGNAYAKIKIINGLNIGTQIGVNYMNVEDYWYYNPVHGDGRGSNGIVDQAFSPTFRYNWQNTIDYTKSFGSNNINVVAGYEIQKTTYRSLEGEGTDLSDVFFGQQGNLISNSFANQFAYGSTAENAFKSLFGRLNYNFANKYLISASIRHDNLSALPWDKQGATLPGASIGWRVSKESFFTALSKIFSDFKLRASYAKVGNVNIGNYPYAGLFAAKQYGDWSGLYYSQMGNSDLKFETSKKWDIGTDMSFLDNKIQLSVDYFRNNIDNLILAVNTPPSLGVPNNYYYANVGKMYNQGWEFTINTTNISNKDFQWNTTFNFTYVRNKIQTLVDHNDIINTYNINREGNAISSFYGYVSKGVNSQNGNPIYEKADGSLVQYDGSVNNYYVYDPSDPTNETTSAVLNAADKKVLGQADPKFYGGFTNNFTYKNFDLGLTLTYAGGNKIYNITRQETLLNQQFQNNSTEILSRWTTVGQVTDVPKLYYARQAGINQTGSLNSRFLEKADFIRAQSMTLGYSFDKKLLSKAKINSLRIYAQAQNLFVISGYKGLDPELGNSVTTNSQAGLDYNTNPVPRSFSVGINLGF